MLACGAACQWQPERAMVAAQLPHGDTVTAQAAAVVPSMMRACSNLKSAVVASNGSVGGCFAVAAAGPGESFNLKLPQPLRRSESDSDNEAGPLRLHDPNKNSA